MNKVTLTLKMMTLMLCSLIFAQTMQASPAYNKPLKHLQSNRTTLTYYLMGDEFVHWAKTTDGYTLLKADNGDYVYAMYDENKNLVPSNVIAHDLFNRNADENKFLSNIDRNYFFSQKQLEQSKQRRAAFNKNIAATNKSLKKSDKQTVHLPVVLVSFPWQAISEENAEQFRHQIQDKDYTENNRTGSVRDYFYDNSFEQMEAVFDVLGPVTLPYDQSFYGTNEEDAWQMPLHALSILDSTQDIDFSIYDNDGDGYIDLVHVIYAGTGEHYGAGDTAIWAHEWNLQEVDTFGLFDGVKLNVYACSSEKNQLGDCDGIGATCHEMGHAFGLPDMYDSDYEGSGGTAATTETWDVMSSGGYNNMSLTPPNLSVVERSIIGWMAPDTLTDGIFTLQSLSLTNTGYYFSLTDNEFLTFELRNKDKWDAFIPGKGMLIYHSQHSKLDNWMEANDVNTDPSDRGHYIEPASGNNSTIDHSSTPFPGSLDVTSKDYFDLVDGNTLYIAVNDIKYNEDGNIVFHFVATPKAKFEIEIDGITTSSANVNGQITTEYEITNTVLQYRKQSEQNYAEISLTDNPFSVELNNLEEATQYLCRIAITINDTVYYSSEKKFRTLCASTLINTFPWHESFESGIDCWSVEGDQGTQWSAETELSSQGYTMATADDGLYYAYFKVTAMSYTPVSSRLISPTIDISSLDDATLTFSYMNISAAQPSLTVEYRVSENDEWIELFEVNENILSGEWYPTWYTESVKLPVSSPTLQIAFNASDNYLMGVLVDNVSITDSLNPLSVTDITTEEGLAFEITPNPAKDKINISGYGEITIFNNAGQSVKSVKNINGYIELDVSDLESGIYTVRLLSENGVSTQKLIKL